MIYEWLAQLISWFYDLWIMIYEWLAQLISWFYDL